MMIVTLEMLTTADSWITTDELCNEAHETLTFVLPSASFCLLQHSSGGGVPGPSQRTYAQSLGLQQSLPQSVCRHQEDGFRSLAHDTRSLHLAEILLQPLSSDPLPDGAQTSGVVRDQ